MLRRAGAIAAAMLAAGVLVTSAGMAGAAQKPTISQVQQKLSKLTSLEDQAVQQYDQAAQIQASATQRLALVNRTVSADRAQFQSMRIGIAQIASAAYESGNLGSAGVGPLLTSGNPQAVMSQASALLQLSGARGAEMKRFITVARQLTAAQQAARRTETAVAALGKQRLARKKSIATALASQKALLAQLTTQQQAAVSVGTGGTTTGTYTGPTTTQAEKAIAFAYGQLGKPYLWGATGPGSYDCSGLVQAAWASAGIAIPRDTYEQWAALPHVPLSNLQPGDLLFFDGIGHVSIYVGGNMFIDAPQTGEFVEKVSLSVSWYASTLVGAARP
jgi:cell wall-associated NlpC family hydrolase